MLNKKFKKLTDIGFVGFGFSGILDNDFWTIWFSGCAFGKPMAAAGYWFFGFSDTGMIDLYINQLLIQM